jgi:phosphoglycolate phosphatase
MKYMIAIFDLDGTILNTLEDLADSTNYALKTCGYPERTMDEVRQFVGNGIRKLMERAVPEGTPVEEIDREIAAADACKMEHDISPESFEALKQHKYLLLR